MAGHATRRRFARVGAGAAILAASLAYASGFGAPDAAAGRASAPPAGVARSSGLEPRQFGRGFAEQDFPLVAEFDADDSGRLDATERRAAREYAERAGLSRTRWGNRFGYTPEPGPRLTPEDVRPYPTSPFYDTGTIRTLFLTFENADWEHELMAFKRTDVDVPGRLTVDGRTYRDVGVQFHGNSSFNGVPLGFKHSMRIDVEFAHNGQNVQGYRTLLLLNAHEDPTFLRTLLTMQIARDYFPAPRANLVRVVINDESWGIFVNQQQFNKDMTRDLFNSEEGVRWKVNGTRNTDAGGLTYLGDDAASYRLGYEIKTRDVPASWTSLAQFTRVLHQTPAGELESAVEDHLDIEAALKFLAVENAIVNSDGYWSKASDYNLYRTPGGRFYLLPYDVNGTFATGFGPASSRSGSVRLHPLVSADDPSAPLASRLLAVPSLRARYLTYVRQIATKWLDWTSLGPIVVRHQAAIDADVRSDTRKLVAYEAFRQSAAELRGFADERRAYLLEVTAPAPAATQPAPNRP